MRKIKHYGHISIKFLDVMFGAIIAIGFGQWFAVSDRATVFFAAFLFAHIMLIEIWINYDPTVRKFPTKNPYFLILDLALIFNMSFLIYYSMFDLQKFLMSIIALKVVGGLWAERPLKEYKIRGSNLSYLKYIRKRNLLETVPFLFLYHLAGRLDPSVLLTMIVFVWLAFRVYDAARVENIIKSDAA
ncbi:MAG: hypothetical protein HY515_04485 [Candidatus Aenigmarchaeota archaeon]|nr:hypothetical protein [Candidatus Aenigmarchaeota archaeon]